MTTRWLDRVLIGSVALVLVMGCASDHGTAPPAGAPATDTGSGPAFIPAPPQPVADPQSFPVWASRYIGSAGGDIAVGGMRVHFPAGALANGQYLTLVVDRSEQVLVSVKPDGIALQSPAVIQLDDVTRTDGPGYDELSFYDVDGPDPVALPTTNDGRIVQAPIPTTSEFLLGGTRSDLAGMRPVRYLFGWGYVTRLIKAETGGSVESDRITLTVPPGALERDTYITVRQTNKNGALAAELEPHGIRFLTPVTLEVDLHWLYWQPYTDWKIFWLNDASGSWEDQGGTFQDQTVTASLWHFSIYAPGSGRAGW